MLKRWIRTSLFAALVAVSASVVISLGVLGFFVLWLTSNLLAAALSTAALLFYVFVYTLYLKRAITAGIGAFLAIIGFSGAGLIQASPATLVTRGDWTSPGLCSAKLLAMAAPCQPESST